MFEFLVKNFSFNNFESEDNIHFFSIPIGHETLVKFSRDGPGPKIIENAGLEFQISRSGFWSKLLKIAGPGPKR